jgi:hypothetical protein
VSISFDFDEVPLHPLACVLGYSVRQFNLRLLEALEATTTTESTMGMQMVFRTGVFHTRFDIYWCA